MAFSQEIKIFTKNTLILVFFFTLVIHLFWGYILSIFGFSAQAQNDTNFERANVVYIGNVATALSLNLGGGKSFLESSISSPFDISNISVSEVMNNPLTGQEQLIAKNMAAITAYVKVLKIDIQQLLSESMDRASTLDQHISLLKNYYTKTQERLALLGDQKNDINSLLQKSLEDEAIAKRVLQSSYTTFEYEGVDTAILGFIQAKNLSTRARIYGIYVDRFTRSYTLLQKKNLEILGVLVSNRDALLKKVIVTIPNTGTNLIKELGIIQSESDYQAQKILQ